MPGRACTWRSSPGGGGPCASCPPPHPRPALPDTCTQHRLFRCCSAHHGIADRSGEITMRVFFSSSASCPAGYLYATSSAHHTIANRSGKHRARLLFLLLPALPCGYLHLRPFVQHTTPSLIEKKKSAQADIARVFFSSSSPPLPCRVPVPGGEARCNQLAMV